MFVPSMADSMRMTSMKSRTNHFVPPYTAPPGYALSPATDEVATTCPDFCPMNVGSTAATPLRTPLTFTSTVWCQSSVCSAHRGEGTPARNGRVYPPCVDTTSEIRDFLTLRRARIKPDEVGLQTFGPRRVPGLRREEVA